MPELPGFRVASWDTPLRVNRHRSPGRFHREGSPATQYISLHPLTPWAEYVRFHGLTSAEELAERRLRVYSLRVLDDSITTLGFSDARSYGLEPRDLVSDDWTACQEFAERLRSDAASPKALLVPSAALPGTRNIVILGERVGIPYSWNPVDSGDVPACVTAERSQPPERLLELTRRYGDPHWEFQEWEQGREYAFADLQTVPYGL